MNEAFKSLEQANRSSSFRTIINSTNAQEINKVLEKQFKKMLRNQPMMTKQLIYESAKNIIMHPNNRQMFQQPVA